MSNPFSDLSPDNHDQVLKYLRFFRQKRDGVIRTMERELNDIRSDRLDEDMFSREEVNEYADFVQSAVRTHMSGDISSVINMGALAVHQLLEKAQAKGVEVDLETATLENARLLEAVEKMSMDAMPKNVKRGVALASFKEEAKAMREEQERIEETNARLQSEVNMLKQRLIAAERSSDRLAESKVGQEMNADEQRLQIRRLQNELEEARAENSKRVSETAQFQQMRQMMQSQSGKLRDLRRRLERYEPDACKEDD